MFCIAPEERMKRGSGFAENLNLRPILANVDANIPTPQPKICQICKLTGQKSCIWVECFTCDNLIHKKCWSQFKNKNQKQVLLF